MTIAHWPTLVRSTLGLGFVGAFALTSCSAAPERAGFQDGEVATAQPSTPEEPTEIQHDNMLVAEVDEPMEFEACLEAEEMEGATVEWLDDVVVEAQEVEGLEDQTVEVDGEQVEIPGVPGIVIPEIVGQAGCVIEYPAPGGCLPAVEISDSYIPGYRIPERVLEAVELPDGTVVEEQVQPAIESEPITAEGSFQEQVCQTEPDDAQDGDYVSHVIRPHIQREHILASFNMGPTLNRSSVLTESNDMVSFETLGTYEIPSISVGHAHFEHAYLESYQVEGADHTEYAEKDQEISYTTEGDVLFDSDEHALRSDATSELEAIAVDIENRGGDYAITVEGHTDNLQSEQYADNDELSEKRAESVVAWLKEHSDIADGNVTATGMGEDYPRASNETDAGRQDNRRVVITVTPTDYEPEIDFEAEESGTESQ
ncbi:MAG: OmpA family protein [Micrococcaceae bacterium]|nr:OmpA family protein [Micrococcaceae bacterium]